MRLIWCGLIATTLFAAAPRVELLHSRETSLCADDRFQPGGCTFVQTDARTLKITVGDSAKTKAYAVDVVVPGREPGERRTLSFLVQREERGYGDTVKRYATFFTLPIDADIQILDIFVNALTWDENGAHITIGDK